MDLLGVLDELLELDLADTGFDSTLSTVDDLLDEVLDIDLGSDFFETLAEELDFDFVETFSTDGFSSFSDLEDFILELDDVLISLISFEVSLVTELDSV